MQIYTIPGAMSTGLIIQDRIAELAKYIRKGESIKPERIKHYSKRWKVSIRTVERYAIEAGKLSTDKQVLEIKPNGTLTKILNKDTFFYLISDSMPLFAFRGDTSICAGNSTTIYAHNPHAYEYEYLWSTGSTTDSIVVKGIKAGTYTYSLRVTKGGCVDSSQIKIGVHDCTGIEDYSSPTASIQVYPNPGNGIFTIQVNSQQPIANSYIKVYNVLGQQLYGSSINANGSTEINLSEQPQGIYFYRVITQTEDLVGKGKMLIQH